MSYSIAGQTVFITGASSGIGAAAARQFASAGTKLILVARRTDRLQKLAEEIRSKYSVPVFTIKMDVSRLDSIEAGLRSLPDEFKSIDILVNNAGLALGVNKAQNNPPAEIDIVVDVNIKGVFYLIQAITPGMINRGRGHIINLSSIAGQEVYPGGSVYCATKHAVNAITKSTRIDLVDTPLRVTSISPGLVETEFSVVRFRGDTDAAAKIYQGFDPLVADDIADAILYVATRPPHVQIADMIIFPTSQASATVVHRALNK